MSLTFERKLPIILFFVFLMLTTIGFVFYQNTVSLQDSIAWQKQTQEVIARLDETVALSLVLQNAMKDFIVTGNSTYLESYNRAKPKIQQNLQYMRRLAAHKSSQPDKPDQTEEIDRLEGLLNQYETGINYRIDFRKQHNFEESAPLLGWAEGKGLMDGIRASTDRLKGIETAYLQKREQDLDRKLSRTVIILIFSSIAGIISLALANLVVLSESKKRRTAQVGLIAANEDLERKVDRRTTALKSANEKLEEIASDREILLIKEQSARREAEIANRLRDEFMASVSHELRTPLNSILGWARLMKGGELDDAQANKALTTIIKNSETQNRLIEDLLDVARVISGKLQLDMAEIDPVEVVSTSIETVRPFADSKSIKIALTVDESGAHRGISADRNRLTQVFTNLLTNAIKFSPDGSGVSVSISFQDGLMTTEIRDTGRGISSEFLPMVFERFRQDTTKASNNGGGLGLGLAIVRNLVEMHGGTVRAESGGENSGSTFTVILPTAGEVGEANLVHDQPFNGVQQVGRDNLG